MLSAVKASQFPFASAIECATIDEVSPSGEDLRKGRRDSARRRIYDIAMDSATSNRDDRATNEHPAGDRPSVECRSDTPPTGEAPSAKRPSEVSFTDMLPVRLQAALVVLLVGFLGYLGWTTSSFRSPAGAPAAAHRKVDLNHASETELRLVKGIGPEYARRIVEHRDVHGPFESLDDLRRVDGIGPGIIRQLRAQVMLSWSEPAKEGAVATSPAGLSSRPTPTNVFDPNSASQAQLESLPGIGPKLAQRIIDERSRRPFADPTDLRRVPGIGVKTLERIRPHLRMERGPTAIQ